MVIFGLPTDVGITLWYCMILLSRVSMEIYPQLQKINLKYLWRILCNLDDD